MCMRVNYLNVAMIVNAYCIIGDELREGLGGATCLPAVRTSENAVSAAAFNRALAPKTEWFTYTTLGYL